MRLRSAFVLTALSLFVPAVAQAQPRVDARNLYEKVIAVVPIVGAGTYADPKRPLFAPASGAEMRQLNLHGFYWEPSDDGKFAIVEYTARTRPDFQVFRSDARVRKTFIPGKAKREDIERELKVFKKDFTLERFDRRPR